MDLMLTMLVLGVACGGLLVGVAKAWVETMPSLDLSKFDEKAQTSFFYDKNGDQKTSIVKGSDNFKVGSETYYIKDAKGFAKKLYDSLFDLALKRDKKQKILDKVNGQLHEGV